jgi:RNA polymerase sigma-70 factor, ECF subfamily
LSDVRPISADTPASVVTDAHLWDQVREGDAAALGELYDRHAAAVFGFAFRRAASWSSAEDVLQTTFLRAVADARLRPPRAARRERPRLAAGGGAQRVPQRVPDPRLRQLVERLPEPEPGQDHAAEVARRVDDERRMIVCSRIAMGERSRLAIREHTSSTARRAVHKLPRHERETLELVT